MVEGFKIGSEKLKRYLKIAVDLPNEYNYSLKTYPLLLVLDGQLFYNFLKEDTKVIDMSQIIHSSNKEFICITLQSPTNDLWRLSELNPYYNGNEKDVDKILSIIYFEYITNELIPMLKNRYRINDDIYLLGYKESAIACLYMLYAYNLFKGAGLFSININECSDKLYKDLKNRCDITKELYLVSGSKNTTTIDDDNYYKLCKELEELNITKLKYDYDSNNNNSYDILKNHILDYLNFIF